MRREAAGWLPLTGYSGQSGLPSHINKRCGMHCVSLVIGLAHDLYRPVGHRFLACFMPQRGTKINVGGPFTAIFAPDPGEHFGEGAITIPAYEAFDRTLGAAFTAWTTPYFQEAFRPVRKQMVYQKLRGVHGCVPVNK